MEAIKLKFWIWGIIQNNTLTGIGQKMLLHQVLQNNTWCTTAKTKRGGSTEPPGINTSASLFGQLLKPRARYGGTLSLKCLVTHSEI